MNILSVTLYNISNYGAMLQAWALRHVLEDMGHNVENLYYRKEYPGYFGLRGLLRSRSISSFKNKLAVNQQMLAVEKEIGGWKQTRPYWSISEIRRHPPKSDCYLVGSDQMMRAERMRNFESAVPSLLAFGPDDIKRVGYAVSFGRPDMTTDECVSCAWAIPWLRRFSALSVRESTGTSIMKKLAGLEAPWVPDPTLLLFKDDYRKQFSIPDGVRKNVYTYQLAYCDTSERKRIFDTTVGLACKKFDGQHVDIAPCMPLSYWLTSIANASCVVTNSFHGTIFSINFNTPFISLGFDGEVSWRNDRAINILSKFGLEDRFVLPGEEYRIPSLLEKEIDWERVNRLHAEFVRIGMDYLKANI